MNNLTANYKFYELDTKKPAQLGNYYISEILQSYIIDLINRNLKRTTIMRYLANAPCMSPMTLRQQLLHTARTAEE